MKKILQKSKIQIFIFLFLIIWMELSLFITTNNMDISHYDAITLFFYTLAISSLSLLQIVAPIFVIIVTIWDFHRELKVGYIKYSLMRMNYKTYMRQKITNSLKSIWILPTTALILFLTCFLLTKNFDFSNVIPKQIGTAPDGLPIMTGTIAMINLDFYQIPFQLMFTFFITLLLHSILYCNIGLIMCKKNKNIVVAIVASFLVFIGIDILSESIVANVFIKGLGLTYTNGIFNLLGIWVFCDYTSLVTLIVYSCILVLVSTFLLLHTYRNKEEVIIQSEK